MILNAARQDLVHEAFSWRDTPYHRRGAIKGVGCDCGSFPGMVLVNCGLIPREEFDAVMKEIDALSDDWFMHGADDKYTELLSRYAVKVEDRITYPVPKIESGNIILMQTPNSKRRNHAGIVTDWPMILHCIYDGVSAVNASRDPMWAFQNISVFDPWGKR